MESAIERVSRFLLIPFVVHGCLLPAEPGVDQTDPIVIFSFESDADTAGWSGYGGYRFASDTPPGGGWRSLEVSGGCIVPHVVRSVTVPRAGLTMTLTLWGKNLALGGSVTLRRADGMGEALSLSVTDTLWREYRISAPLGCRAGDVLQLELMSGGIVYSAMRVDQLAIRIDP